MGVYQRGKNSYLARIRVKGKDYCKTFKSKEEAQSWNDYIKKYGHPRAKTYSAFELNSITSINKLVDSQAEKRVKAIEDTLAEIDNMNGTRFEEYCMELLELCGLLPFCTFYKTPATKDFGADIIITTPYDTKISVQCKRSLKHVALESVQEVIGSKAIYKAKEAIVITNNYFTENAVELANAADVLLIDRDRLIELINQKNEYLKKVSNKKQWEEFKGLFKSEIKTFDPIAKKIKKKMKEQQSE